MRKLKLDIDSLVVQTWETDETTKREGTVQAHHETEDTTGGPWLCQADCGSVERTCQIALSCQQEFC